ncbi:neural cell adhesion molecule 1-A-like isoform X2 [Crassostrea virginica]|uniref:Hemicentin-2-like n=1 Tax=Crassostrea virginica TaxID=6565 RepID=A0A8B8AGE6_CRAVI|nr:hemicentin-2-like [Crassostrea virginica]
MNLTCATSYCNPQANITWYKSSLDITNQSSFIIYKSGDLLGTVSSLIIKAVKEDNGKRVYCRATNAPRNSVKSNEQTLNILYEPEVRSSPPSPYRVREGETATLVCTVIDANPSTNITWRWFKRDSGSFFLLVHNGPIYVITNISREISKRYRYSCLVSNTVGTSYAADIVIDVQYTPEVISNITSPYRVREGQTATLVCTVTDANPNISITWKWIKLDSPHMVLHNGSHFTIPNIKRGRAGPYSCAASNSVGASEAAIIFVDVQYEPEVWSGSSSPYKVREGDTAILACTVIDANPNAIITWIWVKTDSPNYVLHNGHNYTIPSIQRGRSGSYSCTASNSVGTSEPATVYLDIQFQPSIEERDALVVNENEKVVLTRRIYSNPLSNVSWYDESQLLKSEIAVTTTNLIIEKARCTDTKNFTIIASNTLQSNVRSFVELIVNCRPIPDVKNITLWVSDGISLAFSTKIIAYPKPRFTLMFENRTELNGIEDRLAVNAANHFTLYLYKTTIDQIDYGTYYLHINNTFGEAIVYVYILQPEKPKRPIIVEASCNVKSAQIHWTSTFNGGLTQTFIAMAITAQQEYTRFGPICDKGENISHFIHLQNLQPSTKYAFYIVAQNKHGISSSEKLECKTFEDETRDGNSGIAGSVVGSLGLVAMILVTIFLLQKRYTCIIKLKKRKGIKRNETSDIASHYATVTERENTERSLYDELTQNRDQYESVLMKDREENNTKVYEKLQKTDTVD